MTVAEKKQILKNDLINVRNHANTNFFKKILLPDFLFRIFFNEKQSKITEKYVNGFYYIAKYQQNFKIAKQLKEHAGNFEKDFESHFNELYKINKKRSKNEKQINFIEAFRKCTELHEKHAALQSTILSFDLDEFGTNYKRASVAAQLIDSSAHTIGVFNDKDYMENFYNAALEELGWNR